MKKKTKESAGYGGYGPGQWRQGSKRYSIFLSSAAADFLNYLIDAAVEHCEEYNDWFFCTEVRVLVEKRMTGRTQQRLLKELVTSRIVDLEYRDTNRKAIKLRHIRINKKALDWWLKQTAHISLRYSKQPGGCTKFVPFDIAAALKRLDELGKPISKLREGGPGRPPSIATET